MTRTSISDTEEYRQVCKQAANDNEYFKVFRQNPIYNQILEHVTREEGQAYLYYIKKHMKDFDLYRDKFQTSDLIGGPRLEDYGEDGIWSPTTLRYVKVLAELEEYFGSLQDFEIVEIGSGYGGQCKIIQDHTKITYYDIFDLKESNLLSCKFLSNFSLCPMIFCDEFSLPSSYDLVISNYAFSELTLELQKKYIGYVLDNAIRGYITFNNISKPNGIDSMSPAQFKKYIKRRGGFCIEEFPKTHEDNFIGIFGV